MPRTLDDAIRDANAQGVAVHNLFQMPDGSWRATLKVFGATWDLAVNPVYLNYADGDDPAECIDRAIASSDKIPWKKRAAEAVQAMDDGTCTATLRAADRPRVAAAKAAHHNKPAIADAPPKPKPKPRSTLDEVEAMMAGRAAKTVEGLRRKTLDDKLNDLL